MKSCFAVAWIAALGLLVWIVNDPQLPEPVAVHFDVRGAPNGWMSRSAFVRSAVGQALGVPALLIGLTYAIRFLPARFLNVPHAGYWRDPRHFGEACAILFRASLGFVSVLVFWQVLLTQRLVAANRLSPPRLDSGQVVLLTVLLLVFTLGWGIALLRRFQRLEPPGRTASSPGLSPDP